MQSLQQPAMYNVDSEQTLKYYENIYTKKRPQSVASVLGFSLVEQYYFAVQSQLI